MSVPRRAGSTALLAALALTVLTFAALPHGVARAQSSPLTVTDSPTSYRVSNGSVGVSITKSPWLLSVIGPTGTTLVAERSATLPDQTSNHTARANANVDQEGHDKAYPGLATVSTRPLSYLRSGSWKHVTGFTSATVSGQVVTIKAVTSEGSTASVVLTFRGPAIDLRFTPKGDAAQAVAESWQPQSTEHFFGGGGRFVRPELTGLSVPLWVSHGIGADRYTYTNEIAVPYLSSTGGWAVADNRGARGELAVSVPERPGSVSAIFEDDHLDLTLYSGSLQQMLSAYTLDVGRSPAPPQWAFTPMWYDDERNHAAEIDEDVASLQNAGIPVGAYWIDNPFQDRQGDFKPSASYFPDFPGWVQRMHDQNIRVMTWVSPFMSHGSRVQRAGGVLVGGAPADGNDHTYVPARGISEHADLTDPTTYQAVVDAATDLLRSGVDGFKLDRGEEDFGDGAEFADGTPNRLEHSRYVLAYDKAMRQACTNAHPDGSCLLVARGGVGGSSKYVAHWAGDSLSGDGPLGLLPAVHHLLSEAMSGQPYWASDIGGYTRLRAKDGTDELGLADPKLMIAPQPGTFVRWAQFGAVSPIWESPNHPTEYDDATVAAIRKAAILHDRLAPYTHAAALKAEADGTPIAQPLALAFPGDPVAPTVDDEYLFDGCLLAAPLHTGVEQAGPASRSVYLPAGGWTNVFTGARALGPLTTDVTSPYDEFPLYAADGCDIPLSTFANLDGPAPVVPEVAVPALLPGLALALAALVALTRRRTA